MLEGLRRQMNPALIITQREVRDQFRDWRIIFPVIVLTIFFPALMNFTAGQLVGFVERYGAPIIGDRLIPFLLMVVGFFPISVSLVIALESFVGEKERGSIEPLLSSPLRDWQLYLGKLLAAMAPPLTASYLGIGVYLAGVYFKVGWRPEPILLIQILLLTTVQALVMVSGAVVVSSQTTSVRAANLLASFIIIPMALLIQGESVVMFWGRYNILWWAIAGLVVIAGLLIRSGVAHFSREELLGRELDTLNLKWGWKIFARSFTGEASSPGEWYRHTLGLVSGKMRTPVLIMVGALAAGLLIGAGQARVFVLPPKLLSWDNLNEGFVEGLKSLRFYSVAGIGTVWLHNVRSIVLASLLGLFSFGVLGIIVLMAPIMLIGYFMASVATAGLSPLTFFSAFVLPHGVLEIPAMVLAGAAILRLGATLAAPAHNQTVGEAMLTSLGDWARVVVGLVLPLLAGAAVLEVLVTPQVLVWIFGG
jgi:uncharacterized membrane protein SpoIIM required for sporulation/ABC-type transport system involved in multi-copper enzyme maturation permease subunit